MIGFGVSFVGLFIYGMLGVIVSARSAVADDLPHREMIEGHLKARDIVDERVLRAMGETRREAFVPEAMKPQAYQDQPLPIGHGQTISQPYIVALMTQVLEPKPTDRVLEVGTGSGYQAAVLSRLVAQVYSVEIVEELAQKALTALAAERIGNVLVRTGGGYKGWPEEAPFDAIIVTCAPDHVPQPLMNQLREGGRMIIPVGEEGGIQKLVLLTKVKGEVRQRKILPVRFVPMTRETD